MQGKLYLIPTLLAETTVEAVIPNEVRRIVAETDIFIVENVRTARRFISKTGHSKAIDELTFFELNKHTNTNDTDTYLLALDRGENIGLMSEAGCPAVADPGALIVEKAHLKGVQVVPLVGPSSILMSLMASGLNGQSFAFVGYLPIEKNERAKQLRHLEARSAQEKQTQIFIEAPYRNMQLMNDILLNCRPSTRLCIAVDITAGSEYIVTKTIYDWKGKLPEIHKKTAIFLILA